MAFAVGEQCRHAALLHALCHREQQAVGSTDLLQTRVSEAALGSARLHARVASCLHGLSRPYSCCQANVGRFWRRSQRASGQRASCHVHRTLLHRRNVIMCSVRGKWPPAHHRQVGSKLSIFQRQRYCLALNELIMGQCVAQRVSLSFTRKCGPKLTGFLTR